MPAPIALRTSDPKFSPRQEPIPQHPLPVFHQRTPGHYGGQRAIGQFEVAYALVDEQGRLSPFSVPTVIDASTIEWDVIVRTGDIDMWSKAIGSFWAFRPVGSQSWHILGCQQNVQIPSKCTRPFMPVSGWDHSLGGFKLWHCIDWPGVSDPYWCQTSPLPQPPAPYVSVRCLPNIDLEIAVAWVSEFGEGPLSDPVSAPAVVGFSSLTHATIDLYSNCIPPQAVTGKAVYIRKPGQPWHRQARVQQAGANKMVIDQFEETGIEPPVTVGVVHLSSLHLAMRDWSRDVIVDSDQELTGPVVSEFEGKSWLWEGVNHAVSRYLLVPDGLGYWYLTCDGIKTDDLRPMLNASGEERMAVWNEWVAAFASAYGDNIVLSEGWGIDGPVITFVGKYAATDMTSRFSFYFSWSTTDPVLIAEFCKTGKAWSSEPLTGFQKFNRTISTENGGTVKVWDKTTGIAKSWPQWIENSQRTHLVGFEFHLNETDCAIGFVDHSGGGAFHFNPRHCSVGISPTNPNVNTYGMRCDHSNRGPAWADHTASEVYAEGFYSESKFNIVVEGQQAANWTFWNTTLNGRGGFDSAIVTQGNAGAVKFLGRITVDNARCFVAFTWGTRLDAENLWIDQGFPCWFCISGNTWPKINIRGNKVNQWENWLHVVEMPAGSLPYKSVLNLADLDSQSNGAIDAKVCGAGMSTAARVNGWEEVPMLSALNYSGKPVVVVEP